MHRANICLTCSLPAIGTRGGAVCAILGRGYLGSDATRNSYTSSFHFCAVHSAYQTAPHHHFPPSLGERVMFSQGTRNYSLLQRRAAAVPDDVEKLGSSATFFWPRHADAFNEIGNLHLTLFEYVHLMLCAKLPWPPKGFCMHIPAVKDGQGRRISHLPHACIY
jgi:hypothetical protein